jgi:peptidoglycan/xylan/chitin deacetylase (PgdA/CDA1 family)
MSEWFYRALLPVYRQGRRLKNRALNLIDPPVVVLIYHRVTVLPTDPHLLAVSPENFRTQMRFLKENCKIVRFEDDWSELREQAVAVTFDDGYADNIQEALPILEESGIPATFFISTGNIGTHDEFWWDELERIILGSVHYPEQFQLHDQEYAGNWFTRNEKERQTLHDDLHQLTGRVGPDRREDWLTQLRKWGGLDRTGRRDYRPLGVEELQALASSPWATIGAHTVTHTPLATLPGDEQRYEIAASRQYLEQLLGREITTFSYPFGRKCHYNRATVRICRELGFRKVASNFPGQAHRWTDHLQIPRQLVRNWDVGTFAAKMKDFWT